MSRTPFMPLWVSDFLGDTLDLDATEIGAYMLLLMAQWNRDGDSLPNDPKKLQRVARCGRNWPKIWATVGRFFQTDENGVYSKRLRLEAQNVASKREVNARNGARGGRAKSLKDKDDGLANATQTLERNSSIPEPEPYIREDTNVSLSLVPTDEGPDLIGEAVELFKEAAGKSGWPIPRILSKSRKSALSARLKECGGIEGWKIALEKASASDHCCGRNNRGWVLTFDFITNANSFAKLMEGNYDNRNSNNQPAGRRIGGGTVDAFAAVAAELQGGSGAGG